MSTLFLLVIITKSVLSQTACLWGRDDQYHNINGQYYYQGDFNGAPWYKNTAYDGWTVLYLYVAYGYYYVTWGEPTYSPSSALARCASINPWNCGFGKWEIWNTSSLSFVGDAAVQFMSTTCPEWECDAIITDIQYMGCDDIFPVKIGTNAWSNTDGDRYFYFNYLDFRWLCGDSHDYPHQWPDNDYWSLDIACAERGWIDTTKGSTVSIYFENPFYQIQQIECVQTPTSSPTKKPSVGP
eukprot:840368_1